MPSSPTSAHAVCPTLLPAPPQVAAFWAKAERVVSYKVFVAVQDRKRQARSGLGGCWVVGGEGGAEGSRGRAVGEGQGAWLAARCCGSQGPQAPGAWAGAG